MSYDIVIIGAGITGTMLARDLSKYQLKIALVDKENDVASGATMANSAIVHTGYDPEEGTLKGKLNVIGANLYPKILEDLHCKYKTVGAFICACGNEEEKHLDVLANRASKRNIEYEFLTGDKARELEPNLNDDVTKVLSFPTTKIIYPWEVAIACTEVAIKNGVELFLNEEVKGIDKKDNLYIVQTTNQSFETKIVINASGIHADKISNMVSNNTSFTMTPRKGEYYVIDHNINYVDHVIFPVPSSKGKGVLAVPTVYGNTLIGPNSDYISGTVDTGTSTLGLEYVRENIVKTMKNVPFQYTIRHFAGLRPSSSSSDFIIEELKDNKGFINVASIESPGLASAPAISEYVIDEFISKDIDLVINEHAVMTREKPVVMADLTHEEKQEKIKQNPLYGKIVCRCEEISEQEIIDAIHSTCGATTINGVKRRVRPGMGKCQGGFCEPRVLEILMRELGKNANEIALDSLSSKVIYKENR